MILHEWSVVTELEIIERLYSIEIHAIHLYEKIIPPPLSQQFFLLAICASATIFTSDFSRFLSLLSMALHTVCS